MSVAHYIDGLLDNARLAGKSLKTIGSESGFPKPNVLSMIRTGATKLPFRRIPRLAQALGAEPRAMLALAMEEYQPEIWAVLRAVLDIPFKAAHDAAIGVAP